MAAVHVPGVEVLGDHLPAENDGKLMVPEVDVVHALGAMLGGGGVHYVVGVRRIQQLQLVPVLVYAGATPGGHSHLG